MVKKITAILCILSAIAVPCLAQTWGSNPTLNEFERYYVKSLNEFMHRFNADEIPTFIKSNSSENVRERCILALFDLEQVPDSTCDKAKSIMKFISFVCSNNIMLHIQDSGLYAEARCLFKYKKKEIELNLVFVYENIRDDFYRWALAGVNGVSGAGLLDTNLYGYLNPVQHELHFPALSEAFPHLNGYITKRNEVDLLSYVAGLAESGVLKFEGCQSVTYYFFQVPGYLFSVSVHPRLRSNAGWLIHDLLEIPDQYKLLFIKELTDS